MIAKKTIEELNQIELSGTMDMYALEEAQINFKAGNPIEEWITVDTAEMTIFDDWRKVGSFIDEDGKQCPMITPRYTFKGEDEPQWLMFIDEIENFIPQRGHQYELSVRRFYIKSDPFCHLFELIQVLSDTIVEGK